MRILLIAGPNGAGKTTFANAYLPGEAACHEFVNADLIAAGLSPFRPEHASVRAGRLMLARMQELIHLRESFGFETTLATRSFARQIPVWQSLGYAVELHFLRLPDPEFAIRRVAQRVRMGGHSVPEETIRRRFARGLENLHRDYLPVANRWAIYDSASTPPRLLEAGPAPASTRETSRPYASKPLPPQADGSSDARFAGAEAALRRASEAAIARARAAGIEPVIHHPKETKEPGGSEV